MKLRLVSSAKETRGIQRNGAKQCRGGGRGQFAICALALKCHPRSTVSDLISHRITAKRSPWRTVWSLIPSKELPVLFAAPVYLIGCLFCLWFEVWIHNSDK